MVRVIARGRTAVGAAGGVLAMAVVGGCSALGGDVASRLAEPGSERETTSSETGQVFASDVDVGDCLPNPTTSLADGENEIERVRTVSCLEQHVEEVYATVTLVGIEFQGIEVNSVRAYIGCIGRFEDFVGMPYAESILEVGSLTPTEESWAIGDRVVLCTVYHSEGDRLTGSLRNAHDASYELRDAATGQVTRETDVDWLKIVPGDCVQEVSDDYHETLVPCAEPHAEEVYAQFELSDGDEYPGDDEVEELANAGCEERFDEFVGQAYADSPLDFYYYTPIEESWLGGDRLVQCRIFDPEGDVTGSLRGTGVQT
jgi:hypothetical protein